MEHNSYFDDAGYPRNTQGQVLDPTTGEPLTDREMAIILAGLDPETVRAFETAVEMSLRQNKAARGQR
jgi:hypothetical protein